MPASLVSSARPLRERQIVLWFVLCLSLTVAYQVYSAYSVYYDRVYRQVTQSPAEYALHATAALWPGHPFYAGKDHAPDQYRIGILLPVAWICDKVGVHKYYIGLVVVDFLACMGCCLLLYANLGSSALMRALEPPSQRLLVAILLILLSFPLSWVTLFERPETLPSALYLAAILFLLERLRRVRSRPGIILVAVLLSIWQGLVRADVPLVFGCAVALVWWMNRRKAGDQASRYGVAAGMLIAAFAAAVQLYLQRILYPAATYPPDTGVFQGFANLSPRRLIPCLDAFLPFVAALIAGSRFRRQLDVCDLTALAAAALYLPLYLTVAVVTEVRVFIPFLLLITPTVAKLVFLLVTGADVQPASDSGSAGYASPLA